MIRVKNVEVFGWKYVIFNKIINDLFGIIEIKIGDVNVIVMGF